MSVVPASDPSNPDAQPGWKVLVVDDDPSVHELTTLVLQSLRYAERPLHFLLATSAAAARELAYLHPDLAVVLLDVVMESDHAGLEFVRYLREDLGNRSTRIVLRTGQPGFAPEHQVIARYDINDYREKTELTSRKLNSVMVMALRSYRDILAAMDAERATAEAEVARRVAEDGDRAKSLLLANVSHEIRTPLNAMLGMTYLALRTPLSPTQQDYLRKSHAAGIALRRIVDDLLDASRIEAGRIRFVLRPFSMPDLVGHVRAMTAQRAQDKGLAYDIVVDPDLPSPLIGDPDRIGQILTNLLSNAIKFTERGGVALAVSRRNSGSQRVELEFAVRDTGIGIAEGDLARLFQPFAQVDGSTSRRYGGTGLGLSICRQLARQMGGEVEVDSSPGHGSCFVLRIALDCAQHEEVRTVGAAGVATAFPPGLRPVLIVDDDALNREIVAEILREADIASETAENGRVAAERLQHRGASAYSAVLIDIHMPELDGSGLAQRLRTDDRFIDLPLLAMTAAASGPERSDLLDHGMDDVIVKPVDPQELLTILARWTGACADLPRRDASGPTTRSIVADPAPGIGDLEPLATLRDMLARFDGEAAAQLERGRAGIETLLGAELVRRIAERISVYDFETALGLISNHEATQRGR